MWWRVLIYLAGKLGFLSVTWDLIKRARRDRQPFVPRSPKVMDSAPSVPENRSDPSVSLRSGVWNWYPDNARGGGSVVRFYQAADEAAEMTAPFLGESAALTEEDLVRVAGDARTRTWRRPTGEVGRLEHSCYGSTHMIRVELGSTRPLEVMVMGDHPTRLPWEGLGWARVEELEEWLATQMREGSGKTAV